MRADFQSEVVEDELSGVEGVRLYKTRSNVIYLLIEEWMEGIKIRSSAQNGITV